MTSTSEENGDNGATLYLTWKEMIALGLSVLSSAMRGVIPRDEAMAIAAKMADACQTHLS